MRIAAQLVKTNKKVAKSREMSRKARIKFEVAWDTYVKHENRLTEREVDAAFIAKDLKRALWEENPEEAEEAIEVMVEESSSSSDEDAAGLDRL
jgi:hypothetical protein